MEKIYAHTRKDSPMSEWEPLYGENSHEERTVKYIRQFRSPFKCESKKVAASLLDVLARYHDMGKASEAFQSYLRGMCDSVDHKTAAVKWVMEQWPQYGMLLAYAFHGHHSGLPNGTALFFSSKVLGEIPSEVIDALPQEMRRLPALPPVMIAGQGAQMQDERAFALMMAVRMLHSCLIDADWLATEEYTNPEISSKRQQRPFSDIAKMARDLEAYIGERESGATGRINELRRQIHHSCLAAAQKLPGVYQLNVPTGGGKTLSSLSFALNHARLHGLERVIYVIPYTSIIDQTAREFRAIFGEYAVVEHHSNLVEENDSDSNRFASENWDARLIITTNVQFFESLFACKNKKCRKLHNMAHSVVVFDEVQTLPASLLKPCLYAMKTLQRDFGCSLVLCTATQPTVINHGRFNIGWNPGEVSSLIGVPLELQLAREMKRVDVEYLGKMQQDKLIEHFTQSGATSALFIVNLTRQAQELHADLEALHVPGLYHLSARMCQKHRLAVLEEVRMRLKHGEPTVLVSTRVVEAGVDISFPVVYRDMCGLDSLAQSAGRCNRHGERDKGRVYLYENEGYKLPSSFVDLRDAIYALSDVMLQHPEQELLSADMVEHYFRDFYNKRERGCPSWDKNRIINVETLFPPKIWDFPAMADSFRMIEQNQQSVIISYGDAAELLLQEIKGRLQAGYMPSRRMYRSLQQLSVAVYSNEWESLRQHCFRLHEKSDIWILYNSELYDSQRGLLRTSEQTIDYVF